MEKYDFLIVGAGFAGSVIAERLASQLNKKVLIIDRRNHIGGNCYDCYDRAGVLIQKYGAHLFHTKHKEVFEYLSKFTKWHKYEHRVKACLCHSGADVTSAEEALANARNVILNTAKNLSRMRKTPSFVLYDLPINLNTINKFFHKKLTPQGCTRFLEQIRAKIKNPRNAEEQVISKVGWDIYRAFFEKYTMKQWERHPRDLEPLVTARIPIRFNTDDRYFDDQYQFMPRLGFTALFKKMLAHPNITIMLGTDFKEIKNISRAKARDKITYRNLIYTGRIDEFFNHKFGPLPYRSLRFKFKTFNKPFYQKYTVINYPNNYKFTKCVEIKHATKQKINKTTVGWEYPAASGDPYYPIPQSKNQKLYEKYFSLAQTLKNVYFIGRLGQYRYLNMDQVVLEALNLYKKVSKI